MSQYDIEKFDPPPDPDLVCCICQCVLAQAVESPCRHVFCQACIERWLTNRHTCPTCRKQTRKEDLKPVLPLVQNMLNRLLMICDYRDNGCLDKVMLEYYEQHVRDCGYEMKQCRFNKCGIRLLKMHLEEHETRLCEHRESACGGDCGLMVPLSERPTHNCVIALKTHIDEKNRMIETLKTKLQELNNLSQSLNDQLEQLRNHVDENRPLNRTSVFFSPFSSSDTDETDFMSDDLSQESFFDDMSNQSAENSNAAVDAGNGGDNNVVNDVVNDVVEQVERTVVTSLFDLSSRLERVRNQMRSVLDTGVMSENDNLNDAVLIPSAAAALNAIASNNTDASGNARNDNVSNRGDGNNGERRNFASVNFSSSPASPDDSRWSNIDDHDNMQQNSDNSFDQHNSDDLDDLESNDGPEDTDSNHSDLSDMPLDSDYEADRSADPLVDNSHRQREQYNQGHVVMSDPPGSPSNSSMSGYSSSTSIPSAYSSLHSPRIEESDALSPPTSPASAATSSVFESPNFASSSIVNSSRRESDSASHWSSGDEWKEEDRNSNDEGSFADSSFSIASSPNRSSPTRDDATTEGNTSYEAQNVSATSYSDGRHSDSEVESEMNDSAKSNRDHCESTVFDDEDSDHERDWSNTTGDHSPESNSDASNDEHAKRRGSRSEWNSRFKRSTQNHEEDSNSDGTASESDHRDGETSESTVVHESSGFDTDESHNEPDSTENHKESCVISGQQSDTGTEKLGSASACQVISSDSSDESESMKYLTKRIKRVKYEKLPSDKTKVSNNVNNVNIGSHLGKECAYASKPGSTLKRKREKLEDAMSQNQCKKAKLSSQPLSNSEPLVTVSSMSMQNADKTHSRRGRSCTIQSSNSNQENNGQSLNVKIDLSLINYSGQLVACPTSNAAGPTSRATVIQSRSNVSPHHSSTALKHDSDASAVLVHCSTKQPHKPSIARSTEASQPTNHRQSRYPTRRRDLQDSTARNAGVISSPASINSVHNSSPSNREFPNSWNDDSDSASDKTWEPGSDQDNDTDVSVTDGEAEGVESDGSYTVEIPKTVADLLGEYDSDDSDDSWTVGMG